LGEEHRAVADQRRRRVVARDDQLVAEAQDLVARELLAVELRVEERAHEIAGPTALALVEQERELLVDALRGLADRLGDALRRVRREHLALVAEDGLAPLRR